MPDFMSPEDYQTLAAGRIKGVGQSGAAGYGYAAPLAASKTGQKSAFQQLALERIRQAGSRRKKSDLLQKELMALDAENMQAGPLDWAGTLIGGIGAVKGLEERDKIRSMYGL